MNLLICMKHYAVPHGRNRLRTRRKVERQLWQKSWIIFLHLYLKLTKLYFTEDIPLFERVKAPDIPKGPPQVFGKVAFRIFLLLPGANPIKKFQRKIRLYATMWPIREATIGHVTDLIVRFQRSIEFYDERKFYRIGSMLSHCDLEIETFESKSIENEVSSSNQKLEKLPSFSFSWSYLTTAAAS